MIDGLKLTVTGEELCRLLGQRIEHHQQQAERWKREEARAPEEHSDDDPVLPEQMCAYEAERHEWRAEVLEFIRRHVDADETYRMGETDLVFSELLPAKPGSIEQEEYEERTSVGFHLGRIAKNMSFLNVSAPAL